MNYGYLWLGFHTAGDHLHQKRGGFARETLGCCAPWWLRWIFRDSQDQVWVTVGDCHFSTKDVQLHNRIHGNRIRLEYKRQTNTNQYSTYNYIDGYWLVIWQNTNKFLWRITNLCRPTPDCPHEWESLTLHP